MGATATEGMPDALRKPSRWEKPCLRLARGIRATPFVFKQRVLGLVHSQLAVDLGRGAVGAVDVEPQAANIGALKTNLSNMPVQSLKHAVPAMFAGDVHALNPPEIRVAPVAPFAGHHCLPDHVPLDLGHEVSPPARILERVSHAGSGRVVV